ncbi:MAG: TetR/AcrR family transcriptional regulator [Ktedonobacteraceae bacterium]|nr:TetR/AcrR family transcriptional regulator [Ktedonobacteraceae bacterium]
MTGEVENSESREHVLRVAERLFSERGYTAVTLKDIAEELGVRQAALYYHVPGGKEDLFVEVTKRSFIRHRKGLEEASKRDEASLSAQLNAMASWLLSQPPLDLLRMARSDLPALSKEHAKELYELGYASLDEPIQGVLMQAYQRGEIRLIDAQVMGAVFLSSMDTIHDMHRYKGLSKEVLARDVIEIWLDGLRRR